ncbi:MAG: radical SAM protein [Candidatus Woesearchaeota archaeon]
MDKIVLVSFNGYPQTPSAFLPDNGLGGLAACLIQAGHEPLILDFNTPESMKRLYGKSPEELENNQNQYSREIAEIILDQQPSLVGMKLWTGEGFRVSTITADWLKKLNPKLPVCGGGPHVDIFGEEVFEVTHSFDFLSSGEGEETIVELANFIKGKQDITRVPNLMYMSNGAVKKNKQQRIADLDALPVPTYDTKVYPAFEEKIRILVTEWTRGCPYQCNFCVHPAKSGIVSRDRSTERIVQELETYKTTYGAHVFRSGDSDTSRPALEGVAEKLASQEYGFTYAGTTHMNNIRSDHLAAMRKAGYASIFFGMESGSQEILDYSIDKKLKKETIRRVVTDTKAAGITVITSVIVPAPGETEKTKKETLELLVETRPDSVPVSIPIIAPHSKWYNQAEKYGIRLTEQHNRELMYFTPKLLLAPSQWDRLSYQVDGKSFLELARESNDFAQSLEEHGILTQVIDEIILMASCCGTDPRTFRDNMRKHLATGDYKEVRKTIESINQTLS